MRTSLIAISLAALSPSIGSTLNLPLKALEGGVSIEKNSSKEHTISTKGNTSIVWNNLDVEKGEKLQFSQGSSKNAVLNIIQQSHSTSINGSISSNGALYFLNPNGIIIGKHGTIDAASLFIGAALYNGNSFFTNKQHSLIAGKGAIVNEGSLLTNGPLTLFGSQIDNNGIVCAKEHVVRLLVSDKIKIDSKNGQILSVKPNDSSDRQWHINNRGTIEGLRVDLEAVGHPAALAINHSGIIEATGVVRENGRILLQADGGSINVSGKMHSMQSPSKGGIILLHGTNVELSDRAHLDVTGSHGGGIIEVGNRGKTATPTIVARVNKKSTLDASALENGDGGSITVHGSGRVDIFGKLKADGGKEHGHGGNISLLTNGILRNQGTISHHATNGYYGNLLENTRFTNLLGSYGDECPNGDFPAQIESIKTWSIGNRVYLKTFREFWNQMEMYDSSLFPLQTFQFCYDSVKASKLRSPDTLSTYELFSCEGFSTPVEKGKTGGAK